MRVLYPFLAVIAFILIALVGVRIPGGQSLIGIVLPYLAILAFTGGFVFKVLGWARSPVPFRIPTTCGQGVSLPWIKQNKLDCPSTFWGVAGRMLLEVLLFRSLFRNTKASIHKGPQLAYGSSKWLWLVGLTFHYSFLVIVIRHMRLFTNPMPAFLHALEFGDGILQVGAPQLYITDLLLVGALLFLFVRRLVMPQVRYISLANDYFPLFLILGIGITGILMRYFIRVDVVGIKQLAVGLVTFSPKIVGDIGSLFFIHLFLVCLLLIYFPFSKLMHLGGVFLSPTRNMANNSRMKRHINPWNDPNITPHSYAAYEDEFREFMVEAGIPVAKELAKPAESAAAGPAAEAAPAEG